MPVGNILSSGSKMYTSAPSSSTVPLRSETTGWNRGVANRNTDFLLSVRVDQLTGHGFALSLTLAHCPPTPQDWQSTRARFVKRLRRMGMIRLHWLTEWQRRGVPHAHAAVWFDTPVAPVLIRDHWLQAAAAYQAGPFSQDIKPIGKTVGWFEYLAKHATRSVTNYQRSPENIPPQWKGNTGRMWGHMGTWPTAPPKHIEVDERPWCQYRRLMLRYQIGKARRQKDSDRVRYLKAYRQKAPAHTSKAQATPRFFIPEADQWSLLSNALATHWEHRNGPRSARGAQPSIKGMAADE